MSEQIELTDNELERAYRAVSPHLTDVALSRIRPDNAIGVVVDAVVNAVNKAREVDLVGTVRAITSGVAVRVPGDSWSVIWLRFPAESNVREDACVYKDTSATASQISTHWPIIYTPESSS